MEIAQVKWRRSAGVALMMAVMLGWIAAFPKVAMGPYGVMSAADKRMFLDVISGTAAGARGGFADFSDAGCVRAGLCAVAGGGGRGRWLWLYIALCALVALVLGAKFILFAGFSACAAAAMLPLAMSEVSFRGEAKPGLAMLGRLSVLLAVLGAPEWPPWPRLLPRLGKYAGLSIVCAAADRAVAGAGGEKIVLAEAQDLPELLYRGPEWRRWARLYEHGVPAYLRDRDAWRAVPGGEVPEAVKATGASYVLFCPEAGRYAPVADLPRDTLWDALEADAPPVWLRRVGSDAAGWRLYKINP